VNPRPVPCDYDTDPGRFRAFTPPDDVHEPVAQRLLREGLTPILDVGCGRGRLAAALADEARTRWIGVDPSPAQLAGAPRPVIRGEATSVPVRNASAGAVTALWMLYHLAQPVDAIAEAYRVLRPGGLFVASTTRRDDSPELMPPQTPTTFDAEDAPAIVGEVFADVEVETWDAPLLTLPDRDAVRAYLVSHLGDPAIAERVETPLTVTKRGCLVWGRKRR
jgi:SAM-dependent methyltransferase